MTTQIGIDVHKDCLEVLALSAAAGRSRKSFDNTREGRLKLVAWCKLLQPQRCCMESTGPYSAPCAHALYEAGLPVVVANPRAVRDFARLIGSINKTDKADAFVIARYAQTMSPALWIPPSAELQKLGALSRRLDTLKAMRTMETNRLEDERLDPYVEASVRRMADLLALEIEAVEKETVQHVRSHPELDLKVRLLESIPGVAFRTACTILAETATGVPFKSAAELCAYAGLCPRRHESGRFVGKTLLSKRGSSRLRKALYMPAVVAVKWNPVIRDFYERLLAAGKTKMAALAACMRKLLSLCYAVLANETPFRKTEA